MQKRAIILIIIGILFVLLSFYVWNDSGRKNGRQEETGANKLTALYLADQQDNTEKMSEPEMMTEEVTEEVVDYSGTIDCVLSIPQIDICRVVITGGDMDYNLDRHLFVTMQQNMVYGESSYVIGGHQSFIYGHSMNRLEELDIGDSIYIIKDDISYEYEVIEKDMEQWGVDDKDYGADVRKLAIYTCRKQKERPKPYIVVRAELIEN